MDYNLDMVPLTEYEEQQVGLIKSWKCEEPGVVSQAFGVALKPVAWVVNKVIPQAAIRGVLDFSNYAGQWMADNGDIKRDACVNCIEALKTKDLALSDRLADEVHNWAIGLGAAEGGGTGAYGLPGMVVDIPTTITLALRTIHKVGLCYGYEANTKEDADFVLGVMAAAGANSMKEKNAALLTLRTIEVMIAKQTWKKMEEVAAKNVMGKEAGIIAIKNLAKGLGINLTKRKALQAIPLVGAIVGCSVNGWYLKEVGWAARRAYQEKWLIDNRKIIEI